MREILQPEILSPLYGFYQQSEDALPVIVPIQETELPQPYRHLLAHNGDMTSRLEQFYGDKLKLRVLARELTDTLCRREVLLCTVETEKVVEYGAIEIHLTSFPDYIRSEILKGEIPLGGILNHYQVQYRSEPRAFLSLSANDRLKTFFSIPSTATLYGRSNVLLGEAGTIFAEIVEILFVKKN